MPLVPIKLPAGLHAQGTRYQAKNRWFHANLVRFFRNTIRPVGGWAPKIDDQEVPIVVTGEPRGAIMWNVVNQLVHMWGTRTGLFVLDGLGVLTDVTPVSDFVVGNRDTTTGVVTSPNYGEGIYGSGLYGVATDLPFGVVLSDQWAMDTFGDFWVGTLHPVNQEIYTWQVGDANAQAILASNGFAEDAPPQRAGIVVTAGRFLVALGADGVARRVRWADRETLDIWSETPQNTAGAFDLEGEGAIVTGIRGRDETLIFTASDLWAMREVGQPFVHGFQQKGVNCGAISSRCVARFASGYAWMSKRGFFLYDGFVRDIPCEVADRVFSDFAFGQAAKVFTWVNHEFSEIWWFYPSQSQTQLTLLNGDEAPMPMSSVSEFQLGTEECDRYVVWDYAENHWNTGSLQRSAAAATIAPQLANPVLLDVNGNVFEHEVGMSHDGESLFLQSGPYELGRGDKFLHVLEIVPDEDQGSENSLKIGFQFREYPNAAPQFVGLTDLANPLPVRVSGRQVTVDIDQAVDGVDWRLGEFRMDVRQGEGR